jgi:tetratricopeptide (TPR) repeat protein
MSDLEKAKILFSEALAAHESGDFHTARDKLVQALALAPDRVSILTNLSAVLLKLDCPDEAKNYADRSIELEPDNAEGRLNLAGALHKLHHLDMALANYDDALAINPLYSEAWSSRGNTLNELKRHDEALASYDEAIHLRPDYAEAWYNRGNVLSELKRHDEALASYDEAIHLRPDYAEAWYNRGNVLSELKRHDEALASYDEAIHLRPDYAEAWYNRGGTLNTLQRYQDALASTDHALSIRPEHAEAWINRGNSLQHLKRNMEALECFHHAAILSPDNADAHFNLGLLLLSMGEFQLGWGKFKWRWAVRKNRPPINLPLWDGKSYQGTVLVRGEHGLGDQVLYMSMLQQAQAMVSQLVVAVDNRLIPLVRRSIPNVIVISISDQLPEIGISAWIPMGDLGGYFRQAWSDFPLRSVPYLIADSTRAAILRAKLTKQNGIVCGVSWTSNNARIGDYKSIMLRELLEILKIPGITFVDLQYGDTLQERQELSDREKVSLVRLPEIDNTKDIDGLSALIQACDMVVTISNTTAHLAGALGKKMFLILPYSQGRLWYWHEDRERSPWYPSARLYRQPSPDDWNSVIHHVATEIRTMLAALTN